MDAFMRSVHACPGALDEQLPARRDCSDVVAAWDVRSEDICWLARTMELGAVLQSRCLKKARCWLAGIVSPSGTLAAASIGC